MTWLLLLLLIVPGVSIAYSLSPASRARKRTREAVATIESLESEIRTQDENIRNAVSQTASSYVHEIRTERLRSIQVDELKRHGSGMRLQALKDAGLTTLADLQGWNDYRLSQLRGVGPKSAIPIAQIVNKLTSESNALPISHPVLPFSLDRERLLLQAIYRQWWFQSNLSAQSQKLHASVLNVQQRQSEVFEKTAFSRWFWGFGKSEVVKKGIEEADEACRDLEENGPTGQLCQDLSRELQGFRTVCNGRVAIDILVANYEANESFYSRTLAEHLGRNDGSVVHPLKPPTGAKPPAAAPSSPIQQASSFQDPVLQNATSKFRAEDYKTPATIATDATPPQLPHATNENLITLRVGATIPTSTGEFALPKRRPSPTTTGYRWVRPGEAITVHGFTINRGHLYYGEPYRGVAHGTFDSALGVIDPALPAKRNEEGPEGFISRCYSYVAITPDQRFRYLEWLSIGAVGRDEPEFGTLYFLGLERRLLLLAAETQSEVSAQEQADIIREISRLIELFRGSASTFVYYGPRLIEFLSARSLVSAPRPEPSPVWERSYELPVTFLYGLGCFLHGKEPIPFEWALRWAYLEPTIYLRTPATRCNQEFESAFAHTYRSRFGPGLVVAPNKTILKIKYAPLWYAQEGLGTEFTFPGIPDVRALTAPQQCLREIVDESTSMLDSYSRLIGRNPAKSGTLEAYLSLPSALWPAKAHEQLMHLRSTLVETIEPVSCDALLAQLGCTEDAGSAKIVDLARNLLRISIGFEPDVLAGAKRPKSTDTVALFPVSSSDGVDRANSQYKKASLMVALFACVALADGHASDAELEAVEQTLSTWNHLHADLRARLRAQYRLQVHQPASVASLRAKLASLSSDDRLDLATSLSSLANADGVASPAEVKLLEQIYRTLELEPQLLYNHLHSSPRPRCSISSSQVSESANGHRVFLDVERISEVQRETDKVTEMLESVFVEEEAEIPKLNDRVEPVENSSATAAEPQLPGLDPTLWAFLELLMQKSEWAREDLVREASRMQIMLDGALEQINDAALDFTGEVLIEGDDPIFVQQSVLESAE